MPNLPTVLHLKITFQVYVCISNVLTVIILVTFLFQDHSHDLQLSLVLTIFIVISYVTYTLHLFSLYTTLHFAYKSF